MWQLVRLTLIILLIPLFQLRLSRPFPIRLALPDLQW